MIRDVAQFGSALGSGPRGRWFKSSRPDQKSQVRGLKPLTFSLPTLFLDRKHSRFDRNGWLWQVV